MADERAGEHEALVRDLMDKIHGTEEEMPKAEQIEFELGLAQALVGYLRRGEQQGGVSAFAKFLEEEILPRIRGISSDEKEIKTIIVELNIELLRSVWELF